MSTEITSKLAGRPSVSTNASLISIRSGAGVVAVVLVAVDVSINVVAVPDVSCVMEVSASLPQPKTAKAQIVVTKVRVTLPPSPIALVHTRNRLSSQDEHACKSSLGTATSARSNMSSESLEYQPPPAQTANGF